MLKRTKFHIISPSIWPITAATSLLVVLLAIISSFKQLEHSGELIIISILILLSSVSFWFNDIIHESIDKKKHNAPVRNGLTLGFILFLVSEVMLFASFFAALFYLQINPNIMVGFEIPPVGIDIISPIGLSTLNTLLLLTSGYFLSHRLGFLATQTIIQFHPSTAICGIVFSDPFQRTYSDWWDQHLKLVPEEKNELIYYGEKRDEDKVTIVRRFLKFFINFFDGVFSTISTTTFNWSILLGSYFLLLQGFEYVTSSFHINDSVWGSVFFMLTGLHGSHVIIGIVFLTIINLRQYILTKKGNKLNSKPLSLSLGLHFSTWYWHFVDIIWIIVYFVIYIVPFI